MERVEDEAPVTVGCVSFCINKRFPPQMFFFVGILNKKLGNPRESIGFREDLERTFRSAQTPDRRRAQKAGDNPRWGLVKWPSSCGIFQGFF